MATMDLNIYSPDAGESMSQRALRHANNKIESLELMNKQLITMMAFGIWIEHADGHRWIQSAEPMNGDDYSVMLQKYGLCVNNKIYGGVAEAIEVIDCTFGAMTGKSLADWFDQMFDDGPDMRDITGKSRDGIESRISHAEIGKGGLF